MKRKVKYIIFLIVAFAMILTVKSFAGITTTISSTTVKSGDSVTITINSTEGVASGGIKVTSNSGLTFKSVSGGEANDTFVAFAKSDNATSGIATYIFEAPTVSTTTTYTVTFSSQDMKDKDQKSIESSTITATITVEPKETTPEPPPVTEEPKPEPAPTFQDVNQTVYITTGDVNVRESYSTSSRVLGKLAKGTEITRTGIGSNGWSRINYNGTTAYISSQYVTTTKPAEEEKSNNANLKALAVEGYELIPSFSPSTVAYTLQVTNEVTNLTIKAEPEDEKATVSIQGNKDLKEGENLVTISVSAEDGTVKIYEIKVTRLAETTLGLQSLKIEGTDIEDEFSTDKYNYEIEIKELTKLNIEAIANDETATVEIIGNEDLEEGENIITIIVSSEDGEEKVTYQIKVDKILANAQVAQNRKIDSSIYIYIAIGTVLLIALIIVIVYTIRHRNQEEYDYEEEDNYEGFPDELPERQEKQEDIETTQEINTIVGEKNTEETSFEDMDRQSKIDYFLDSYDEEDNDKKGKHF